MRFFRHPRAANADAFKPSPRKPLGCARSSASRGPATGTRSSKLEPLPVGDLIGAQLARQRPGLCSIDCVYWRGRFYNLGPPRRHRDRLRGQHLDAPRLIRERGALLLLVPSPREATVPHRELPGLRLGDAVRPRRIGGA